MIFSVSNPNRELSLAIQAALAQPGHRTPRETALEGLLQNALTYVNTLQEQYTTLLQSHAESLQEIRWTQKLLAVPASVMSPSQKVTLHAAAKAAQHATPNADGLVQIESWKLCQTVGQSKDTFLDNLTYLSEHVGVLRKQTQRVVTEDGAYTTNLYIAPTEHLAHPEQYRVEKPRNHGGERMTCPHCHSDRLQKKVTITCMGCGAVIDERSSQVNPTCPEPPGIAGTVTVQKRQVADPEHASFFAPSQSNLTTDITNIQERQVAIPEKIGVEVHKQEPVSPPMSQLSEISSDPARLMDEAAALLVQIAGDASVHIEMSARGPAKYYEVKRAFSLADARAHLAGTKTKGAMLRRSDGMTRALCYDADTDDNWQRLREAAHLLARAGYIPLVEDSPAGRGGHLWIIFTDLVNAQHAHRHVREIAPMLQDIKEFWPSLGNHKVRLPGGKYVKPGFSQQCKLYDAIGALVAETRQDAARALLSMQTPFQFQFQSREREVGTASPSHLITPEHVAPSVPREPVATSTNGTAAVATSQPKGQPYRWFQFTPQQVAAWYNERHSIEELLPPERNRMGLAHWRGERTASVGYTPDGHGWVDFGGSARRSDGKQDGGDALELQTRVSNQSKSEVMRQAARDLIKEARAALESAAHAGQPLPTWVQNILTPAGQEHYRTLVRSASDVGGLTASCPTKQIPLQHPEPQSPCLETKEESSCCQAQWAWSEATQRYLCWACKSRKAKQSSPSPTQRGPMTFYG